VAEDMLEEIMKKVLILSMICFVQLGWIVAQRGQRSLFQRFLFPPELVMKNQEELQLTEEQRTSIMREVQEIQSEFTALQWDLEKEMEGLTTLLKQITLDEESILQQLETVLELERQVKRNQLLLAVRIRNSLNEDQLRTLRRLRVKSNLQQRARSREPSGTN
jgi:hypothetical protein